MRVFITGTAGFIGYHLCEKLLARGDTVTGLDNLNDYYDVSLKEARLANLTPDKTYYYSLGEPGPGSANVEQTFRTAPPNNKQVER